MKSILVPTDFSQCALNAFAFAQKLAGQTGATLYLLHVYHLPVIDANMPINMIDTLDDEMQQQAMKNLMRLADTAVANSGGHLKDEQVECVVRKGFTVEEIVSVANDIDADIVIMGTTGARGLKELVIGTNTAKVISQLEMPVLGIPDEAEVDSVQRIVYAAQLVKGDTPVIGQLVAFAKCFDAHITILHIIEDYETIDSGMVSSLREAMQDDFEYDKIELDFKVYHDLDEGLNDYLATHNADIIAMFPQKRTFLDRVFHRSLTRKMAFHSKIPLLAFHG